MGPYKPNGFMVDGTQFEELVMRSCYFITVVGRSEMSYRKSRFKQTKKSSIVELHLDRTRLL